MIERTENRGARIARFAAWILTVGILVLTFVPAIFRPVSNLPHVLEHFTAFLFLGAAFAWGYPQRLLRISALAVPLIAILELLQRLAPGRHARVNDFVVNAVATCLGVAFVWLALRSGSRKSAPPLG